MSAKDAHDWLVASGRRGPITTSGLYGLLMMRNHQRHIAEQKVLSGTSVQEVPVHTGKGR